ncbi:polysaccharide lyase family 7 protein [Pseudomonas gingeri]|uniref:Polysaccharide lyase family 7 protein n=1 Tax=Pseudomonas gingeri TaxID=117681 RepID=A0A7Y7XFY2_9PSED|nr:polysaccharide lyase family 7 protein [Pseudomonas gingeri]NWD67376.1 polysaccharide lyase family 7 protein [Pseudomonas gingeri]
MSPGKLINSKFIINSIAAIAMTFSSTYAFSLDANQAPGHNFPLLISAYLLQDFNSANMPEEVPITDNLQNAYFYTNCYNANNCHTGVPEGAIIFNTPSGLKATAHSDYPRVELRGKRTFTVGGPLSASQSGEVYIVQNPQSKSIIFAQIHGDKPGGSELLKLRWKDGAIIAGTKTNYGDKESRSTLLSGIALNDKINYTIEAKGSANEMTLLINVSAEGKTSSQTFSFPKSGWDGVNLYFKAGNYNQTSDTGGDAAIVAYGALNINNP